MTTKTIHIGGMTCINCQNRIEKKLKSTVGIEEALVNYTAGTAALTWNPSVVTFEEIKTIIESLDYKVLNEKAATPVTEITGTLIIILALYMLLRGLGINAITSGLPLAEAGMGYGMLFVIGLVTSVHCIAMCGGTGPKLHRILLRRGGRVKNETTCLFILTIHDILFYHFGRSQIQD